MDEWFDDTVIICVSRQRYEQENKPISSQEDLDLAPSIAVPSPPDTIEHSPAQDTATTPETTPAPPDTEQSSTAPTPPPRRNPPRNRKPPPRYGDFVQH